MTSSGKRILLQTFAAACVAGAAFAQAHAGHDIESSLESAGPRDWHELGRAWPWEPVSWAGLVISIGLYGVGLRRLWRGAGIGHGIRRWEAGCFLGGWLTLFIALVSPLHSWGSMLFSVHMTQHELLMLVAAPLLVLGRPVLPILHALPRAWASELGAASNGQIWRAAWQVVTRPLIAWLLHAVVLWSWHAPVLFEATQESEWVHAAQHLSFLISALLFWWSLFHARASASASGAAVLYLFTTALHSGFLGAMLTFARGVWYPIYGNSPAAWGLTPLEDQQLGGLIMWVPACSVYIVAALAALVRGMRMSERAARQREVFSLPEGVT
ncbi:MAG: hypothetical protein JWM57_481 [Phycisphaerales bacterium]|nr:hypothetical protein [Phycisphaerales bacterium]